jgi:uncharacterized protein YcbK (DUF882 family)
MQLSKHFTLDEFVSPRDKVKPTEAHIENLKDLCELALEPLREALGRPIKVTSGYRSPQYNKSIGGAPGSQHTSGIAADIAVLSDDEMIKAAAIASRIKHVGGIGLYPGEGFIHVDIRQRIGGKPTYWMRKDGKYQGLSIVMRNKVRAHGGLI